MMDDLYVDDNEYVVKSDKKVIQFLNNEKNRINKRAFFNLVSTIPAGVGVFLIPGLVFFKTIHDKTFLDICVICACFWVALIVFIVGLIRSHRMKKLDACEEKALFSKYQLYKGKIIKKITVNVASMNCLTIEVYDNNTDAIMKSVKETFSYRFEHKKDVEIFHEGQELTLIKWDDTEGIYDTPYDIFSIG